MTLSPGAKRQMDMLLASQPEAGPWLAVLSAALEECANPAWEKVAAATTLQPERQAGAPLLAGAHIPVDGALAQRWLRRVLALAADAGPEGSSLRIAARDERLDALGLLEAAINNDAERLDAMAISLDVDVGRPWRGGGAGGDAALAGAAPPLRRRASIPAGVRGSARSAAAGRCWPSNGDWNAPAACAAAAAAAIGRSRASAAPSAA